MTDSGWNEYLTQASPEHALSVAQELAAGDIAIERATVPEEYFTGASFYYTASRENTFLVQVSPHLADVTCSGCGDYLHPGSDGRSYDTSGNPACYPARNGPHVPQFPAHE